MRKKLAAVAMVASLSSLAVAQEKPKPLMKDFMGINGHTVQFKSDLYAPVCRLVRDYHPLDWDLDGKSSNPTNFPMAKYIGWTDHSGKFRSWNRPIDWNEIYGQWVKDGFEIDACVQFGPLIPSKFENLEVEAFNYGKAFASYFGPSHNNLVTSVEIGNEPAGNKEIAHEDYMKLFVNMAKGVREGDPKLKILTATAEAPFEGKPDGWSLPLDLFKDHSDLYDVINVHKYAFKAMWPSFERTYPENVASKYRDIVQNSIDWRDKNAPDKEVWITEFGFDATTKEPAENNKEWKDSTDLQQAQWIVRSFLMFAEMDLDRAYLYWFNDGDTPSFHASSGITRNFEPKMSYYAMRHLYQSLGEYRFARVVEKADEGVYVYEFVNGSNPDQLVWVAWSATGSDKEVEHELAYQGTPRKVERMPTSEQVETVKPVFKADKQNPIFTLTESPLYIWIEK